MLLCMMVYQSILNAITIVNATYIYGHRHFIDLEKLRNIVWKSFIARLQDSVGICGNFNTSFLSTWHKKHFDQSVSCFSSGEIDTRIHFDMSKPKNELEQIKMYVQQLYIRMFVEKNYMYITLDLSTNGYLCLNGAMFTPPWVLAFNCLVVSILYTTLLDCMKFKIIKRRSI